MKMNKVSFVGKLLDWHVCVKRGSPGGADAFAWFVVDPDDAGMLAEYLESCRIDKKVDGRFTMTLDRDE